MADTEPQMEVEQQQEEAVEEVSNAEEAASEVVEEVEGGAETKEEDATEEDAEAVAEEATSWISFCKYQELNSHTLPLNVKWVKIKLEKQKDGFFCFSYHFIICNPFAKRFGSTNLDLEQL